MTPVSRTLNAMAYKARYQERNGSWQTKKATVISYANFNLPSCNDLTMSKQNQKTLEMTTLL